MAKPLATILKKYSDVIAGKIPASEVSNLTLGKEPGVDYAPKMADEREFVASHSVEKHPDRVGNGPDVYSAANIKQTSAENGKHGHFPDPKSKNTYKQANEEVEQGFNSANRKTTLAERIGLKYGKVNEAKDSREYDYEGEMAVTIRASEHLIKMMEPNTNLPEWVQSKIVKAEDYITTAHDYLMSEMNEAAKCNMSEAGTMCEVHGKGACPKEGKESDKANELPMYNGKKDKEGKKVVLLDKDLQEKAESQAQQKLMAMALAYKRGEMKDASPQVKKLADSMPEKQLRDYAATKHKGLPKKVAKESADTPIKMPTNPSNQTADYNSGANLGNFTV
jgi:hypothetical protein